MGAVPKSIVASATKSKSMVKVSVATKAKQAQVQRIKVAQTQKVSAAVKSKVAQIQKIRVMVDRVQVQRLRDLLRRAKKKLPKKIKLKRKPNNNQKRLMGLWVKSFPVKYRPSLASVLYGITGYKIPKSLTGLEIRPILIKRKSMSKRTVRKRRK